MKESIFLVGEKLLEKVLMESKFVIEVDKMANELKTDMRKVLVICNVLEGLRLMDKQGSNVWHWRGKQGLLTTLIMLKKMAEKENMIEQLMMLSKLQTKENPKKVQTDSAIKRENTKYNLVMMTQQLMMIFLVIPNPKVLFLPDISIFLHGPCLTDSRKKTSELKLEEISDVMQSLGLLARVLVKQEVDTKGTIAYHYVGKEVPVVAFLNKESEDDELEEELDAEHGTGAGTHSGVPLLVQKCSGQHTHLVSERPRFNPWLSHLPLLTWFRYLGN